MGELDGIEVMVARTGYTGELGVELCCAEDDVVALWDAVLARGVTPCGLGARDTLRLEVCFPLHGNDISTETDAISAGLGWACALDTEFTGVDALRRIKEEGPERRLVPFVMEERAVPRQGMPIEGGGEVTSGTHSPMLDLGIGMGYVPATSAAPDSELVDRRAREAAARPSREEADLPEGGLVPAAESYPDDLRYHPEHDWARVDGEEATLGITWFAQDSLGELVHYEAPEVGSTVTKDASYGEVESVKAVSDIIAPLSGEVLEVNAKVVDEPETVNDDPYGEGWLDPDPHVRCGRARRAHGRGRVPRARRRAVDGLPQPDGCRPRSRCSPRSASRRSTSSSSRSRHAFASNASSTCPRRSLSWSSSRISRSSPRATSHTGVELLVPRRRDLRPLRAVGRRRAPRAASS